MELPQFINQSSILSENDKRKLSLIDNMPTAEEVDSFRFLPEIQELTNAFIGDDSTRDTHLQLKAKSYLEVDDMQSAWKVLLL